MAWIGRKKQCNLRHDLTNLRFQLTGSITNIMASLGLHVACGTRPPYIY